MTHVFLDGQSLTIEQVHLVAHHPEVQVRLSNLPPASKISRRGGTAGRQEKSPGVTTGFGAFRPRHSALPGGNIAENILLSHAVGVGDHLGRNGARDDAHPRKHPRARLFWHPPGNPAAASGAAER